MLEIWVFALFFFLFGLAFGSFINLAVYRIEKGENLLGRSYCDGKHHQLGLLDLIPVFSYIIYKGKCRTCGTKLEASYPIIELINGVIFVIVFLSLYTNIVNLLFVSIIVEFLFFFAVFDLHYWKVPLRELIIANILAVIYMFYLSVSGHNFGILLNHIFGGLFLALLAYLIYLFSKKRGFGLGDVILFLLVGLTTGLDNSYWFFLVATISGSVFSLPLIFLRSKRKPFNKLMIQFAPFICFACFLCLLFPVQIQAVFSVIFNLT